MCIRDRSVIEITNIRKNETDTHKDRTTTLTAQELSQNEMDDIFQMPDCIPMDDDEIREKAKALFSAGKIML
jgi:hypothetical protein